MEFSFRSLSKDLSVYFQGLHAFGWADEWTWPALWSSSNTCPMGPCPSRNRISRNSHPVTPTDWPSTGSSLHSSWHTMTWDKAGFNPFLWEILQPVHMEGSPPKKNLIAPSGQTTYKNLTISLISPCFMAFCSHKSKTRRAKEIWWTSLWTEAWAWTAEVKNTLGNVAFILMLESLKETVQRCDCTGWGDEGSFHRLCSQGWTENPLLFVSSENNHFPWILFLYPTMQEIFSTHLHFDFEQHGQDTPICRICS